MQVSSSDILVPRFDALPLELQTFLATTTMKVLCCTGLPLASTRWVRSNRHFQATVHFPLTSPIENSGTSKKILQKFFGNAGNQTQAAGSGSKYAIYCAVLPPSSLESLCCTVALLLSVKTSFFPFNAAHIREIFLVPAESREFEIYSNYFQWPQREEPPFTF